MVHAALWCWWFVVFAAVGQADPTPTPPPAAATPAPTTPAPAASPTPTTAPAGETLELVEQQIASAWDRHSSFQARLQSLVETPGAQRSVEVNGIVYVQRQDGDDLQHMDTTTKTTLGQGELASSTYLNQLEISDGHAAYVTRNMGADAHILKIDAKYLQRVAGAELCAQLRTLHTSKLQPSEKIGDQAVFVIESRPKAPMPPVDRMISYISQQDGVLLKVVLRDANEVELRSLNLYDLKFDQQLEPALFQVSLPPGIKVIDQTSPAKDANTNGPAPAPR